MEPAPQPEGVAADAGSALSWLRSLHRVITSVHASLDLSQTLDAVARGVVEAAGFGIAAVNLREPDGDYVIVAVAGSEEARRTLIGTRSPARAWEQVFERAERWGSLIYLDHRLETPEGITDWVPDHAAGERADPGAWHPMDSLLAPLLAPSGEWVGVLSVDAPVSGRLPGPVQREVLELFAEHAAIAVLHARMHSALVDSRVQLEHLATHDPLTGLANRELLRTTLDRLPAGPVGVLVIDLDGFKPVNDTAGHEAGDEVLRTVGQRMQRVLRTGDLLARTGGDEFVVVISGPDTERLLPELAARLRATFLTPVPTPAGPQTVGASIGAATARIPCDLGKLLADADREMYRAKHTR